VNYKKILHFCVDKEEEMATVFVKGLVFVGDGKVLEKACVQVEGERIVKVGKESMPIPRDAKKVDLEGRALFPGFIDSHVHLCLDASPDPVSKLSSEPAPVTAIRAVEQARATLAAGITSIRDMGGKDGVDLAMRDAIRSGTIQGPRMIVSRSMICMSGGHGWQFGRQADGPDDVRRAAREQIREGADLVKLMATGGVLTPGVEPGAEQLTEEELRAGIEEAHKAGRKTATHAMGTKGILNALRAGIDSIEHGVYLDDEAASLMRRRGVQLVPTLSAMYHIEEMGIEGGIPAYAVEKTLRVKPHHLKSVRLARESGIPVAMGTDAGTPFNRHGQNLKEMVLLSRNGYSPSEALQSGTLIAAQVLGLDAVLGTIEEGKLADLVAVAGNPLDDMDILLKPENVSLVIQCGRIAKQTA
jgi:imidazolonepropionase-like amidohydrolase